MSCSRRGFFAASLWGRIARALRKLDTSRSSVFEVPLGADEVPLNGGLVEGVVRRVDG